VRRALGLLGLGVALVACSELIGLSKLEEGPAPTDAGQETTTEASLPVDAGKEGGLPASCFNGVKDNDESDIDCGGATCRKCIAELGCTQKSDCHGDCVAAKCVGCSTSVIAGHPDGGCIDKTETTVAEFAEFLPEASKVVPHPRCQEPDAGAADPTPGGWTEQQAEPNFPVRYVDWCAAWAYCKWRGKHLCGGFTARGAEAGTIAKSVWELACEGTNVFVYPYAGAYVANNCNGADKKLNEPVRVGSLDSCKTAFGGILDLSGNVAEWEDICTIGTGEARKDRCSVRGGSFRSNAAQLTCRSQISADRGSDAEDIGVRCCE